MLLFLIFKRSIDERLTLLRYIIYQEAVKLNKKIYVNNQVVSALVQTNNREYRLFKKLDSNCLFDSL